MSHNAETQAKDIQVDFQYLGDNGNVVTIYQDVTAEQLLSSYQKWLETQDATVPNEWVATRAPDGKLIDLDTGTWDLSFAMDFSINDNVNLYSSENGGFHVILEYKLLVLTARSDLNAVVDALNRGGVNVGIKADTVSNQRRLELTDWTVLTTEEVCNQAFLLPNDTLVCPNVQIVEPDQLSQSAEKIMHEQIIEHDTIVDQEDTPILEASLVAETGAGEELVLSKDQQTPAANTPKIDLVNAPPMAERLGVQTEGESSVVREAGTDMLGRTVGNKSKQQQRQGKHPKAGEQPRQNQRTQRPPRQNQPTPTHRSQGYIPFVWGPAPASGALTGGREGELPQQEAPDVRAVHHGKVRMDPDLLNRLQSHLKKGRLIDGETVINISPSANTALGKFLTMHARTPFEMEPLGKFDSLLGLFGYITCTPRAESMRTWAGGNARHYVRRYELNYFPGWLEVMANAMMVKIMDNAEIVELLEENELPFRAYYVNEDGSSFDVAEDRWLAPIITEIAKTIKRRVNNRKVRPDFSFLTRIEESIARSNQQRLNARV